MGRFQAPRNTCFRKVNYSTNLLSDHFGLYNYIISKEMFTQIIISALYITFICLSILFLPPIRNLFGDVDTTYLKSALFATFMMAITFNGFIAMIVG